MRMAYEGKWGQKNKGWRETKEAVRATGCETVITLVEKRERKEVVNEVLNYRAILRKFRQSQ